MMIYDFDQPINRVGTHSAKWDLAEKLFGSPDVLPMWVADMDFLSPPAVIEAIAQRAEHGIYGYTFEPQSYFDAIIGWMARRHLWAVQQAWIIPCPGVVTALSVMVAALTEPGDKIMIQTPVYHPFYDVVTANGRELVENPLSEHNGTYEMDFDLIERQFQTGVKMLILCSPHNPIGRVWRRGELERLGELCLRYKVFVVSDEIHADLVYSPHTHTPYSALSEELAQQSAVCVAPSKTFNMPGLQSSIIIIANAQSREKTRQLLRQYHISANNCFGIAATEAAYNHGEEWLDQLLEYLQGNADWLADYVAQHVRSVSMARPEGTYLAWLDCRAYNKDAEAWKSFMYKEAKVAFHEGSVFGERGKGFLRVNFACPRALLEEGMRRFGDALQA